MICTVCELVRFPVQTIHQARAEYAHGAGRQRTLISSDERVLPDVKAHLRLPRDSRDGASAPSSSSSSPMLRQDRVNSPLDMLSSEMSCDTKNCLLTCEILWHVPLARGRFSPAASVMMKGCRNFWSPLYMCGCI